MDAQVVGLCGGKGSLPNLFFCASCHELKCSQLCCSAEQPETFFCPSCWETAFPSDAARSGHVCPSCKVCPGCSVPLAAGDAEAQLCSSCGCALPELDGSEESGGGAIAPVAVLLRRSHAFRDTAGGTAPHVDCTTTEAAKLAVWSPRSHNPSDWLGHIASPPCASVAAPLRMPGAGAGAGAGARDPAPVPVVSEGKASLRPVREGMEGAARSSHAQHWLVGSPADSDAAASAQALSASASAEERKRLQLPGLSLGPSSGGPGAHATLEAAAARVAPQRERASAPAAGAAVPSAPAAAAFGSSAVLEGLSARRRGLAALMLGDGGHRAGAGAGASAGAGDGGESEGAPLPGSTGAGDGGESEGASRSSDTTLTPSTLSAALTLSLASHVQLQALHTRRCVACVGRGEPGILVAPNAAPLQLLAAGALPERGPAAWYRKAATAAPLIPLFQLLPLDAARGRETLLPPHLAASGLRSQLQATISAALRGATLASAAAPAAEAGDAGTRGTITVAVSVPLALRITNPTDLPILVALTSTSAAGPVPAAATALTRSSEDSGVQAPAWLSFPAEHGDASGVPSGAQADSTSTSSASPAPAPAPSFLGAAIDELLASARARASASASAGNIAVVSVGGFEEMSVDEARSEAEEQEAAAEDAETLLQAAGAVDAAAAARLRHLLVSPSSSSAPPSSGVVLSRWRHVVTLRCQLQVRVEMPAGAASLGSLGDSGGDPAWLHVRAAAHALVLFSPATLAHRAGMAGPSPAALAANCALKLPLDFSCSVPVPVPVPVAL